MKNYFTKFELSLWAMSALLIVVSFVAFDRNNYLTLFTSLIGATSLIYNAKGNPFGQFLMVIFSILYGIISYSFCYYGEMITYMGMTGPMAFLALISWLKNPYQNNKAEVRENHISKNEIWLMLVLTIVVTTAFYFVLKYFNTSYLLISTFSVATSFFAVYLTFRRSPYFAIAYAANDIVLIVLWLLASKTEFSYISVVICFAAFLVNDLYGFYNWRNMEIRQRNSN